MFTYPFVSGIILGILLTLFVFWIIRVKKNTKRNTADSTGKKPGLTDIGGGKEDKEIKKPGKPD